MAVERDAKSGRFLPGSVGNPAGRPPRATEDAYLRTMGECVSLDDWRAITKRAVEDAKGDNDWQAQNAARKWLSDYLLPTREQLVRLRGDGEAPAIVLREVIVERPA